MKRASLAVIVMTLVVAPVAGQAPSDSLFIHRINDEGFQRSQVMDIARWLTDVYGPRLTGSALDSMAGAWAMGRMRQWGLTNVHPEPFAFDHPSWINERFYMQVVSPAPFPVLGMAAAWSVGTDSLVHAQVAIARIRVAADTARLAGTLRGKAVLVGAPFEGTSLAPAASWRFTPTLLDEMARTGEDWITLHPELLVELNRRRKEPPVAGQRIRAADIMTFLARQGVAVILTADDGVGGNFEVGGDWDLPVPQVALAPEHFSRMYRLVEAGTPVKMEFDIRNRVSAGPAVPFNVLGDIPGTDKKDEIVMIGGHLDSWAGGTGATDNAAGAAVMMEAMRILKTTGVPLRRTVRIALWNGEEQGGLGSVAYIQDHLASRHLDGRLPNCCWTYAPKPESGHLDAYFNLDTGAGMIRAVDTYKNAAARPIFEQWVRVLAGDSLHITHVLALGNDPSDDGSFDTAGLPAFYFVQDPLDYVRGTHHTSQDLYDRLGADEMNHNAVVVAAFVYLVANSERMIPRKPAAAH